MDNMAWKKVQIAREKDRPIALDYIENIFDEFIEFHGDRDYAKDGAIVCGIASLNNVNYTIIAEQKGRDTKENIKRNFGMPGRAIKNHFLENLKDYKLTKCFNCIKTCDRKTIPYCITQALINSVTGNIDNGLIFCGSNVDRIDKITDVKTVISELIKEANEL